MVDSEKIAKYIRDLEIHINHARELQKVKKEDFLNNWRIYDLVDRKLHLILEAFLSIGEMVISEFKFRKPDSYTDIPKILGENRVIPDNLKRELIQLAKFRNVLVHEYLYLDHERVYEHLQKDIGVVQKFLNYIKRFVKEGERKPRIKPQR